MGLRGRLRKLEAERQGLPCPECGIGRDARGRIVISTEWMPDDPDERCGLCGRRLWLVIEVVYDPPAPGTDAEADAEGGGVIANG